MKTQIIITAKKEGLFSKAHGSVWGTFGMFGKRSVTVEIDGNLYDVPANNQPTAFDVEPGEHTLVFTDPRFNIKNKTRKFMWGFFGFVADVGSGNMSLSGTERMASVGELEQNENVVNCTLIDGDILRITCRAKDNGKVKVKIQK